MYPIINIIKFSLPSQSFFAILGLIVSLVVAVMMAKSHKISNKNILLCAVAVIVGALIGGRLAYAAVNYAEVIEYFASLAHFEFKQIWGALSSVFGGSVFYGGFIGALIGLGIYSARIPKEKRSTVFDIYAVCVPLFHCFGRIGCFLGGCCYGIESKFGITVHNNQLVPEINDVSRVPVALIEAYFNILLFFLLNKIFGKGKLRGRLLYLYMLCYSVIRFCTEFLRGDEIRGIWFGFSTSQWISAILFVIAFFYFVFHMVSTFKDLFAKGDGSLPTNKNIFRAILLWVLTFGLYGIVIMTSVSKNINRTASAYDKKHTMNYCLLFFLVGWLTLGIGYIVWYYRLTKRVSNELARRNIDYLFTKNDFWLWNVAGLMVLAGPFVYLHKLFRAINLINADFNQKGE